MKQPLVGYLRPLRTTAILLGLLLLLAIGFHFVAAQYWLPQRMHALLLDAPESEIASRMKTTLASSPHPYEDLSRWMASDRAVLALEAARQMQTRIDRLETQPGIAIADQAFQLAQAIKNQLPNYPSQTKSQVHAMARQMAHWNLGKTSPRQGPFLVLIEEITRESRTQAPPTDLAANDQMMWDYLKSNESIDDSPEQFPKLDQLESIALREGLPWKQLAMPGEVPKSAETNLVIEASEQNNTQVLPANGRVAIDEPLKLPTLIESPHQVPTGPQPTASLPDFRRLTTLEIMWKLHGQDERFVRHAREVLRSRNFSDADLELASRLTHPNVAHRLQLVRELPIMPREDRTHWLYYMTKDPDEGVRYSAAAALLTSTDPRLLRRLKADMATDPSPRVQALIRR